MVGIVIISHSEYAYSIIKTSEMLAGKHSFFRNISLLEGCDPEAYGQMIKDCVNDLKNKGYQDVLVLADLYGGTPCNQAIKNLLLEDIPVVVGVNIPMVLQIALANCDETDSKQLAQMAVKVGKESIFNAADKIRNILEEEK
ncbi:MAG: PTS sugar transporter subunit IIA [Erysipelotrichaceae bacterium]